MNTGRVSLLAKYRLEKGMTQEQLSAASGVTTRTIQRIENGAVTPRGQTLKLLAGALETTTGSLTLQDEPLTPAAAQPSKDVTRLLPLYHIMPFAGIIFPFTNIILPFVLWVMKKDEHPFYNIQGRQVINFQLTLTIFIALSIFIMVLYFPVGFPMMIAGYVTWGIFCLLNTIKAVKKKQVHYPLSIPFLKLS
ncbi:MAG TPA: helix-turn-helix domain-containing protein [Chitinophaga sp.]|uniref:helix-turn-helix domain-containing protein n=1 Tax=Chitinophaga sp. TaxID=1869181 RepID=UPI002F929370